MNRARERRRRRRQHYRAPRRLPCSPARELPRCPERPWEVAGRRQQLGRARRYLETFDISNAYQAKLRDVTLALVSYMEDYWCTPERSADFERWWRVISRYTGVLTSDALTTRGGRGRLCRLLNENQEGFADL